MSAKPFSLFKKIKGRFPFGDSDLFRYFVLAKELYNDEQKYTFYRTADVRPTTFLLDKYKILKFSRKNGGEGMLNTSMPGSIWS